MIQLRKDIIHHQDTKDTKPRRLRHRSHGVLGVLVVNFSLLFVAATASAAAAPACAGDCNGDGMVSVSELITGVRISLGAAPLDDCSAFDVGGDGQVRIDELITAVNAALAGCPATPTPTATPSATASSVVAESPTPTATPTDTAQPGTPTATPTQPMVSGHWREDPLAVTDSTCPEMITNGFAADLASRPPCEQIVEMTSDTTVSFEDCTGTRLEGSLDREGTVRATYPTTTDNTIEDCPVSLTASFVVTAGNSPTTVAYTFDVAFAATCHIDNCTIHADGTWTRL